MRRGRTLLLGLVALGLFSCLPARLDAQFLKWAADAQGGIALPIGKLGNIQQFGANVGIAGTYWFSRAVAFRFGGGGSFLKGKDVFDEETQTTVRAPSLNLWYFNGGFEFELTNPKTSTWSLDINVGAGGTHTVPRFGTGASGVAGSPKTNFTLNVGIKLLEEVHPTIDVFVQAEGYLMFLDEANTEWLNPGGIGTGFVVPITVGFRIKT
jgi:hypothetical protein